MHGRGHATWWFPDWPDEMPRCWGAMLVRRYRSGQSKLGATFVFVFLLVLIGSKPQADAQGNRSFYEGKTIQLLVASGPAATTDISARLVGRYLGKHMPGNPGVVVRNMPR